MFILAYTLQINLQTFVIFFLFNGTPLVEKDKSLLEFGRLYKFSKREDAT